MREKDETRTEPFYQLADWATVEEGMTGDQEAVATCDWSTEPSILTLSSPRYLPCIIEGAFLAAWYDCRQDRYLVLCPACHRLIAYHGLDALYLAMVWSERQRCQGCRAKISFERNPGLIGAFLGFWYGRGAFPQSPSWVEAIPQHECSMWAKEIRAGLEAATAPTISLVTQGA